MATDKQQTPAPGESPAKGQTSGQNAATQVGQVLQDLGNITRRLPTTRARRQRAAPRHGPPPSREQITGMIDALGDPQHPDHANAADLLVEMGPPAVPALNDVVSHGRSWLTIYRATDVLGRIGDGRAVGPLIQALQHPNSNVRWGAVRALSQVGDVRALLELRRVAQQDQGKTTWGESVSGAAQSALDQMRARSVWGQSLELVKTALASVLMILALIMAYSVVTTLRSELDNVGRVLPGQVVPQVRTALPAPTTAATAEAAAAAAPAVEPTLAAATATLEPQPLSGTVIQGANVRPVPRVDNQPIGRLSQGDEVIFIARTPDSLWYRVRLGTRRADTSNIRNPDGSGAGWVSAALLSVPVGDVPVENIAAPADVTPVPTP